MRSLCDLPALAMYAEQRAQAFVGADHHARARNLANYVKAEMETLIASPPADPEDPALPGSRVGYNVEDLLACANATIAELDRMEV